MCHAIWHQRKMALLQIREYYGMDRATEVGRLYATWGTETCHCHCQFITLAGSWGQIQILLKRFCETNWIIAKEGWKRTMHRHLIPHPPQSSSRQCAFLWLLNNWILFFFLMKNFEDFPWNCWIFLNNSSLESCSHLAKHLESEYFPSLSVNISVPHRSPEMKLTCNISSIFSWSNIIKMGSHCGMVLVV